MLNRGSDVEEKRPASEDRGVGRDAHAKVRLVVRAAGRDARIRHAGVPVRPRHVEGPVRRDDADGVGGREVLRIGTQRRPFREPGVVAHAPVRAEREASVMRDRDVHVAENVVERVVPPIAPEDRDRPVRQDADGGRGLSGAPGVVAQADRRPEGLGAVRRADVVDVRAVAGRSGRNGRVRDVDGPVGADGERDGTGVGRCSGNSGAVPEMRDDEAQKGRNVERQISASVGDVDVTVRADRGRGLTIVGDERGTAERAAGIGGAAEDEPPVVVERVVPAGEVDAPGARRGPRVDGEPRVARDEVPVNRVRLLKRAPAVRGPDEERRPGQGRRRGDGEERPVRSERDVRSPARRGHRQCGGRRERRA